MKFFDKNIVVTGDIYDAHLVDYLVGTEYFSVEELTRLIAEYIYVAMVDKYI